MSEAQPLSDAGAEADSLEVLLIRAEDMGYHHSVSNRSHYRSWATVDLLYRLIATLLAKSIEEAEDGTP